VKITRVVDTKEKRMSMRMKVKSARRRYRQAVRDAWMEVDVRSDRPVTPSRTIARRIAARTGLPVEVVTSGDFRDCGTGHPGRILEMQRYRRLVAAGGDDLALMLGGGGAEVTVDHGAAARP